MPKLFPVLIMNTGAYNKFETATSARGHRLHNGLRKLFFFLQTNGPFDGVTPC